MKNFLRKLKSKAGESLIESMAAILIFTMASIVMYTMVTTAADINRTAKEMDEKNQEHMIAVEKGLPENKIATGTVTFSMIDASNNATVLATENVDIYGGNTADELFTYFIQTGG